MKTDKFYLNSNIEALKLKTLAEKSGVKEKHIQYWMTKIKSNIGNISIDTYLHKFEEEIRRSIINKSVNNSRFWEYRSIASSSYELNMKADANYARSLPPKKLECFFSNNNDLLKSDNCIIFNSGMAALNAAIIIAQKITTEKLSTYTGYFETTALLKEITTKYESFSNANQYLNTILKSNFTFLEIPVCSTEMHNITYQELIYTLKEKKNTQKLFILIIDSTLQLEDKNILEGLLNLNIKILIFKIRSGLKLDQLGLEILNLGIIEVYSNLESKHNEFIVNMLKNYRAVAGLAPDYNSYLRLIDPPFNFRDIKQYKLCISKNTLEMYKLITNLNSSYFEVVYRKGLPFLYLKPAYEMNLVNFIDDLIINVKHNKGYLPYGTSFGFRHTRLEIINNLRTPPFIRLMPGEYLGPSNSLLLAALEDKNAKKYKK